MQNHEYGVNKSHELDRIFLFRFYFQILKVSHKGKKGEGGVGNITGSREKNWRGNDKRSGKYKELKKVIRKVLVKSKNISRGE